MKELSMVEQAKRLSMELHRILVEMPAEDFDQYMQWSLEQARELEGLGHYDDSRVLKGVE